MVMVKGKDKDLTIKDIKQLVNEINEDKKNLKKAKRWFGKKKYRINLLNSLSRNYLLLGINQFMLDLFSETKSSFLLSVEYLKEYYENNYTIPGYLEIQSLTAGVLAGAFEIVNEFSDNIFNDFNIVEPIETIDAGFEVIKADYAVKSILGWLGGADRESIKQMAFISYNKDDKDFKKNQFKLWASCVYYAMEKNSDSFNENMEFLVEFVKRQCRYGDFKYSEDRDIYLPGLLLIYLAKKDGLNIKIPKIRQYPEAIFSL